MFIKNLEKKRALILKKTAVTARGLRQVSTRYSYFLNVLTVHYYLDIYGMTFTLFISKKFLNLSLPETEIFLHTLMLS